MPLNKETKPKQTWYSIMSPLGFLSIFHRTKTTKLALESAYGYDTLKASVLAVSPKLSSDEAVQYLDGWSLKLTAGTVSNLRSVYDI